GANGSANARVRAAASPRTESRARCEKEGLDPLRRAATIVQGRAEASVAMSPPAMAAALVDDASQKGRRTSPPAIAASASVASTTRCQDPFPGESDASVRGFAARAGTRALSRPRAA